jgi:AraC-like DNA-binding protein
LIFLPHSARKNSLTAIRRGEMAEQLGLSLRTLHRRLAQEGLSYQLVLDNIRRSVATEFLENTHLSRRAGRFDAGARERAVVSARPPFAQARCKRGGPS